MTKTKVIPRNNNQYQTLASTYLVKDQNHQLDNMAHLSNNLYNAALYQLRQQLFKHRKFMNYGWLNKLFKKKNQKRECLLYSQFAYRQMAQQTLRDVDSIWYAWTKATKAYRKAPGKFTGRPRIPNYLPKRQRHVFHVTSQNLKLKNGYLTINPRNGRLNFKLRLDPRIQQVNRVTFKPLSRGYFKVVVQYQLNHEIKYLADNGRYLGIDPGVDNAFTCVSNLAIQPLIINGRPVKSINHYYNKQLTRLSQLHAKMKQCCYNKSTKQGVKTVYYYSDQQRRITTWRNRKIREFSHQATKRIVDYALNNDIHTIVIGKNNGWKRSVNMGKKSNQNFVGIPHAKIIDMLTYKANLHGISVIKTNESYTSQTSFLDHETPEWKNGNKARKKRGISPINRRIKRGLFRSNQGQLINADVNGALQIIKKAFPKALFANGITDFVLNPGKSTIYI